MHLVAAWERFEITAEEYGVCIYLKVCFERGRLFIDDQEIAVLLEGRVLWQVRVKISKVMLQHQWAIFLVDYEKFLKRIIHKLYYKSKNNVYLNFVNDSCLNSVLNKQETPYKLSFSLGADKYLF